LIAIFGGVVLLAAAGFGYYVHNLNARFDPDPPQLTGAKPSDLADAQRQDLDALKALVKLDRAFSPDSAKDFTDKIEALKTEAGQMSAIRFDLEVAGLVALANNFDTELDESSIRLRLKRLPIRMAPFADGVYIVKATAPFADLLGARVTAIGGVAIENAIGRFDSYHGGQDWARRYAGRHYWHAPEALQAVGLSAQSDRALISVVTNDGKTVVRQLNALPSALEAGNSYQSWMDFVPGSNPGREDEQWQDLPGKAPILATGVNEAIVVEPLEKPNALVMTLNPAELSEKEWNGRFEAVLVALRTTKPHHLILNIQRLGSGALPGLAGFAKALPQALPDGAVFIVTGAGTGDRGVELIALVQAAMANRVLTLGLPPGQTRRFWQAAPKVLTLPNSGLKIRFATRLKDYDAGCRSWSDCGMDAGDPAVGPYKQDVTFSPRFVDYVAGRETVIEVIKALIGQPD
jgi:hypothetical protein